MQDRKRKLDSLAAGSGTFNIAYATLGQLIKNEQSWIIAWLNQHSNADEEGLLRVKTSDSKDGLNKLVTAATQLLPKQKLTHEHQNKEVMSLVLHRCWVRYGERLKNAGQVYQHRGRGSLDPPTPAPKAY